MDNIEKSTIEQEELLPTFYLEEENEEENEETTYKISFVTIGGLFANPGIYDLIVKEGEKFTIPKVYRFGQGKICNDQQYLFYPGTTYAIRDGRVYEYSEQVVEIYKFQDNPRWTDDDNSPFQSPCHTAFSVQKWNPELTECLSEAWGYADGYGRVVVPACYDAATNPSCWNVGAVKQHGKWHFISTLTGERIDDREYDDVILCPETGYFSYSAKESGDDRGVIDPLGNVITRPIYGTMPRPMYDGTFETFMASNPETPLLIDRHGNVLHRPAAAPCDTPVEAYDAATYKYNDGDEVDIFDSETPCIIVCKEGKYGLTAYSGRKITDIEYDYIRYYGSSSDEKPSSFFMVMRGDKWGGIDLSGKEILPIAYDSFLNGDSNHIRVSLAGKFGYADIRGAITVPIVYDRLINGSAEVTAGLTDGKWQIIGKDGRTITPPCYDTCECLGLGFFFVTLGNEHFTIDKNGRRLPFVIDCLKESIFPDGEYIFWGKTFDREYLPAYRLARKGIIRRDGTSVIPCIYDDLRPSDRVAASGSSPLATA